MISHPLPPEPKTQGISLELETHVSSIPAICSLIIGVIVKIVPIRVCPKPPTPRALTLSLAPFYEISIHSIGIEIYVVTELL